MANPAKDRLLAQLQANFGPLRQLPRSRSLYAIGNDVARIYVRYSKLHAERNRAFFGLRQVDLRELAGHNSFICYLLDDGSDPLFVPYGDFEEIFRDSEAASDGQYKVQLIREPQSIELYVARQGRFNAEAYVGYELLEHSVKGDQWETPTALSHAQVQTLLVGIGNAKGFDVYVPPHDKGGLDWSLTHPVRLRRNAPDGFGTASHIIAEIDVSWIVRGGSQVQCLFEIEHSTPIYSGLLRFNDVLLTQQGNSRFFVIANEERRSAFARQTQRPTFSRSGLIDLT